MTARNAERLRRLVASRLGVPWRSVRLVLRSGSHRRRRKHCVWPRSWSVVALVGGRAVDTGAQSVHRRWVVARALAYVEADAVTWEERDAVDAALPPLYGRVGRCR